MPFNDMARMIACLLSELSPPIDGGGGGTDPLPTVQYPDIYQIRRFGINESGKILYNDFGEPINGYEAQDNYITFNQIGRIKIAHEKNNESSNMGGITSIDSYITAYVPLVNNLQENDLVVFPPNSKQTYRIKQLSYDTKERLFTAVYEVKSKN